MVAVCDNVHVCLYLQHHELPGDCSVLVWNGGNDNAENSTQGHRKIQPDGQLRKFLFFFPSRLYSLLSSPKLNPGIDTRVCPETQVF